MTGIFRREWRGDVDTETRSGRQRQWVELGGHEPQNARSHWTWKKQRRILSLSLWRAWYLAHTLLLTCRTMRGSSPAALNHQVSGSYGSSRELIQVLHDVNVHQKGKPLLEAVVSVSPGQPQFGQVRTHVVMTDGKNKSHNSNQNTNFTSKTLKSQCYPKKSDNVLSMKFLWKT